MSMKATITLVARCNRSAATAFDRKILLKNYSNAGARTLFARSFATEKSAEKQATHEQDVAAQEAAAAQAAAQLQPQATAAQRAETAKKLLQQLDSLKEELQAMAEKNKELLDKYKRALADSENMRVRLTKQITDAKIFGIQSFCKDLLEVADTLGHATESVPQDQLHEGNPHLKNLFKGLEMTKSSMFQVFKRHGLEQLNPINEKFDPNLHEALFQKVDESAEPNTVVAVTKLGYKLHERCIRPALVGVSKTP